MPSACRQPHRDRPSSSKRTRKKKKRTTTKPRLGTKRATTPKPATQAKAKTAGPKMPKTKSSARRSKPKKKPNGVDLSGKEEAVAARAARITTGTTGRGIITLPQHLTPPGRGLAQGRGGDLGAEPRLARGHLEAARPPPLTGPAGGTAARHPAA